VGVIKYQDEKVKSLPFLLGSVSMSSSPKVKFPD